MQIDQITGDTIDLQLPAWRPGRYELQHFAKNIRRFAVFDQHDQPLPVRKVTKDRWRVQLNGASSLRVDYDYFALVPGEHRLDAGSSYADPTHFWYVNPINLCIYADGRLEEPCSLTLAIPDHWDIACGLPREGRTLLASDYHALVDSPLIASDTLQAIRYEARGVACTVWIQGWHYYLPPSFDREQIIRDSPVFRKPRSICSAIFRSPTITF